MPLHPELLAILACPRCRGKLRLTEAGDGLACDACRLLYRIEDDIPIMLEGEACPLDAPGKP